MICFPQQTPEQVVGAPSCVESGRDVISVEYFLTVSLFSYASFYGQCCYFPDGVLRGKASSLRQFRPRTCRKIERCFCVLTFPISRQRGLSFVRGDVSCGDGTLEQVGVEC